MDYRLLDRLQTLAKPLPPKNKVNKKEVNKKKRELFQHFQKNRAMA
jgi:hypothetical protein